jgi:D-arabinose 1-dehydrogenase-like Zn-dependent alcohol dehydrogenase
MRLATLQRVQPRRRFRDLDYRRSGASGAASRRVVCAGIHMSYIPSVPHRLLWEERQIVSVANLTRQDGLDFLRLAPEMGIITQTTACPLRQTK